MKVLLKVFSDILSSVHQNKSFQCKFCNENFAKRFSGNWCSTTQELCSQKKETISDCAGTKFSH